MMMLQSKPLELAGLRHAFFTREGGVSEGVYASLNGGLGSNDDLRNVAENRRRMAAALHVAEGHLVSCFQIHSADAVVATVPWTRADAPRADAIATATPGLAVGVSVADCGPVLFADGAARVVCAAHAGWKGALTGILEAAVTAMEELGAERARIVAAIGPLIRQSSYEVGPEFVDRFATEDPGFRRFFTASPKAGHGMFDLPAFIEMRARQAGVASFEDIRVSTYANEESCFSYRRSVHRGEADYGRLVSAIALI